MNDGLTSTLITIAGSLLGAVVGGFITFFVMRNIEHLKWKKERQEKYLGLKREALAAALEWVEPMRNAEIRASSLIMAAIRGDIDEEHLLKEFPYLLGELVNKDLPANQRAVLPDKIYSAGHHIVREFDEIRIIGVKYGQEARIKGKPLVGFQECSDKLNAIGQQITELESELRDAYHRTFE